MDPVPVVAFTRGPVLESIHYGSVAVVDHQGRLIASAGDPDRLVLLRSAAKPVQAMVVVETGAADRFGATEAELAIMAGSHSGEPRHTQLVAAMLARAGLGVEALRCGIHPPLHEATRQQLAAAGQAPTALHHNCSGKHCGMLWACLHRGWDERTYERPDHPLQRRIRSTLAVLADWPEASVQLAIDGCGAPTFGLPLRSAARMFAALVGGGQLSQTHAQAAHRVRQAMLARPELVAGQGRFDTDLMLAARGQVLAKAGAEGCYGAALADRSWGVALKIEDGGSRAATVALLEVLRQLDALGSPALEQLHQHARPPVLNYRAEVVGEGRPLLQLTAGGASAEAVLPPAGPGLSGA